jgi:hypothetical protein
MLKPKTFLKALEMLNHNLRKGKDFLKDKRLTQIEKNIIECFFLLKNSKSNEVISLLKHSKTEDPIIESQRKLFLGIAYNNLSFFKEAEIELKQAFLKIQNSDLIRQKFIVLNNLFILFLNQKNKKQCLLTMNEMEKYVDHKISEVSFLRAKFNYNVLIDNEDKALATLESLKKLTKYMSEAQSSAFFLDQFLFYIKKEEFKLCHDLLKEMRFKRSFNTSANYNFMKVLLEHIDLNKPIYTNESDFKDYPLLLNQIKCLKFLEEGNLNEAERHWNELYKISSEIYSQTPFEYKGEKCLFSIALNKHQQNLKLNELISFKINSNHREDQLMEILSHSNIPIPQAVLYKMIWGQEAESKSEFNKLAQMIYSLKKKRNLTIKSRKSCYFIEKETKIA